MRSALSARDLLASEALRDGQVVGGGAGLDATVTSVKLITEGYDWGDFTHGTGVVFDAGS